MVGALVDVRLWTFGVPPARAVHLPPPLGADDRPGVGEVLGEQSAEDERPAVALGVGDPSGGVDEPCEGVVGDREAVDAEPVERRPRARGPRRRRDRPTPTRRPCGTSPRPRRPTSPGGRPRRRAPRRVRGRWHRRRGHRRAVRHPVRNTGRPCAERTGALRMICPPCPNPCTSTSPTSSASPCDATTTPRTVARDRRCAHALAGDARHRLERVPGREVERAAGPPLHAGQHRAQLRQSCGHARRAGPHPGPPQLQPVARGVDRGRHRARRPLRAPVPRRVPARVRGVGGRRPSAQRERTRRVP